MLTSYDDLPIHQVGGPFETAGTGDHRFFDRYWFVAYDPAGKAQFASGLGLYRNMNVLDGFASVLLGTTQHNVRVSRRLRPDFETIGAGPLLYEVKKGLQTFRLSMAENEFGVSFDLIWDADFPAFDEPHHRRFIDGMLYEDYRRFYQFGKVTGWIKVDDQHIDLGEGWFGFRDRSFGIRPAVGGPPPAKPPAAARQGRETTFISGVGFAVEDCHGSFHVQEDDEGNRFYSGGTLVRREGEGWAMHDVRNVDCKLRLIPGTLRVEGLDFSFSAGGKDYEFLGTPLSAPFAYQGYGYHDGYWDEKGLGAWRGDNVIEGETYDVSDPEHVIDRGGRRTFPRTMPLEYPLKVLVNGKPGYSDSMVGITGPHPRYNPK
jgi:hypothetical protein